MQQRACAQPVRVDPGAVLFRGFPKIFHFLIGIITGYVLAYLMQRVDTTAIASSHFLAYPNVTTPSFDWQVILTIIPSLSLNTSASARHRQYCRQRPRQRSGSGPLADGQRHFNHYFRIHRLDSE
ncbi:hypothetical protein J2Z22_002176 [Paenibacillus forsythiae]|uniref:Uncharacterized protein n=1 Tax=Paenibacillus forsythiae TaxID=365616 RepID=A0ABU3H7E7_9BACL|nr:hypothetical protein [Paenibacillus forsythiae]